MHRMGSQPFPSAREMIRSKRNGSLTGMAPEAMITIWSMLATAGRWKALRRGRISVREPVPSLWRVMTTRSPTRGVIFW